MCIKVIAEEALNKFQAKLLEKPEPLVRGIKFFGLSGELSNYLTTYSEREIPFKVVSYSHHFPPGQGLVVGVGL